MFVTLKKLFTLFNKKTKTKKKKKKEKQNELPCSQNGMEMSYDDLNPAMGMVVESSLLLICMLYR